MYRSTIEIIYGQMETQMEGDILRAVQKYGINVDKEELTRALQYDRNQYEKGYADGKADAMAENVMCKNCNNYRCDWCEKVVDSPDPNMPRTCQYFWGRTNADRIRAMSDEALAHLLNISSCPSENQSNCFGMSCEQCWEKWLKQPAEEGDGNG